MSIDLIHGPSRGKVDGKIMVFEIGSRRPLKIGGVGGGGGRAKGRYNISLGQDVNYVLFFFFVFLKRSHRE